MKGLLTFLCICFISLFFYNIIIISNKKKKYPYSCDMIYLKGKEDVFEFSNVKQHIEENDKISKQKNKNSELLKNILDKKSVISDMGTYSRVTRISQNNSEYNFSSDNFV
jgi:preprotein translocase subunit YajC